MGSILFGLVSLKGQAWAGPATTTRRIAAIDWPAAESLLALGAPPVAISDTGYFRQRVPVPLPESIADIGPFWEINLELLAALAPDAILANASSLIMTPAISEIAPVEIVPEKVEGDRYRLAVYILQHAAAIGGVSSSEVDALARAIDTRLERQRSRLRFPARPVLVALPDQAGRRAMVYGKGSLPDAVLTRLGLDNAWAGPV
ncbi:ABC transporter substrate-binding protein, partial [Rhizobiaceae sp. 2RAB30]